MRWYVALASVALIAGAAYLFWPDAPVPHDILRESTEEQVQLLREEVQRIHEEMQKQR